MSSKTGKGYDLILATLESDPNSVEQIDDFATRWHAVNEGKDENAFPELTECMAQINEIIREFASGERAPSLTADVVMRYITEKLELKTMSAELEASDFCASIPDIGTVFSVSIKEHDVIESPVIAEIEIDNGEEKIVIADAEGRFEKPTKSLVGNDIPHRLYLVVPDSYGVLPEIVRSSKITIKKIRTSNLESKLNNFTVRM